MTMVNSGSKGLIYIYFVDSPSIDLLCGTYHVINYFVDTPLIDLLCGTFSVIKPTLWSILR